METPQKKLKIALIVKWHTDKVGYAPNCLSRAFVDEGHEVHIFTTKYQAYFTHPNYDEIYGKYFGPNILSEGQFKDGQVTVHRLPSWRFGNIIWINKIWSTLSKVKPDIVQSFDINEPHTVKLALYHPFFKYKLFTANHFIVISFRVLGAWKKLDFKKKWYIRLMFWLPGFIIKQVSKKCYAVTRDSKTLAIKFFGLKPSQIEVSTLGVDTQLYFPVNNNNLSKRTELRAKHGVSDDTILCVFSGKITEEKSPLILAQAIELLNANSLKFKAIFIGSGELKAQISNFPNSILVDFVPSSDLADYYRAADIAVWPRSVTTSILDAAACGLPVVVSDQVFAYDLYSNSDIPYSERPNILAAKYLTNNAGALSEVLKTLITKEKREEIGQIVFKRIELNSSWKAIATKRIADYRNL